MADSVPQGATQTRWQDALPVILGTAGGLRGNNAFADRWRQLQQLDRQQKQQAQAMHIQQGQYEIQQQANTRANQDQLIQAVNSLRQFADPTNVVDPAEYEQRRAVALQVAPRLGLDQGFVQSLFNVQPTRFEVNEAKQRIAEIERTYPTLAERSMLEDIAPDVNGPGQAAPVFPMRSGKKLTYAQLRTLAGTQPLTPGGAPMSMRPPAKPENPTEFEAFFTNEYLPAALEERSIAGKTGPLTRTEVRDLKLAAREKWDAASRAPSRPQATPTSQVRTQESRLDEEVAYLLRNPTAATQERWRAIVRAYDGLGVNYLARRDAIARRVASEDARAARTDVTATPADELVAEFDRALEAGGHSPNPGPAPQPTPQSVAPQAGPRRASRADVQAVAQRLGVSYEEAKRQLESRRVVVVDTPTAPAGPVAGSHWAGSHSR